MYVKLNKSTQNFQVVANSFFFLHKIFCTRNYCQDSRALVFCMTSYCDLFEILLYCNVVSQL